MGEPAAKEGDLIVGTEMLAVWVPAGPSQVATPLSHAFSGPINGGLSGNVNIMKMPAATVGSTAVNNPEYLPMPPGTSFVKPPGNKATIKEGSKTVRINGEPAARADDLAITGNVPTKLQVVATGTVRIG